MFADLFTELTRLRTGEACCNMGRRFYLWIYVPKIASRDNLGRQLSPSLNSAHLHSTQWIYPRIRSFLWSNRVVRWGVAA